MERLESRLAMDGAGLSDSSTILRPSESIEVASRSVAPITTLAFRIELTDRDGNRVDTIRVGQEFEARVYVTDLRSLPRNSLSIFSIYTELAIDWDRLEVIGRPILGNHFDLLISERTAHESLQLPELLKQIGGIATTRWPAGISTLLAKVPLRALKEGLTHIATQPIEAGLVASHETLLYSLPEPLTSQDIVHDSMEFTVLAEEAPPTEILYPSIPTSPVLPSPTTPPLISQPLLPPSSPLPIPNPIPNIIPQNQPSDSFDRFPLSLSSNEVPATRANQVSDRTTAADRPLDRVVFVATEAILKGPSETSEVVTASSIDGIPGVESPIVASHFPHRISLEDLVSWITTEWEYEQRVDDPSTIADWSGPELRDAPAIPRWLHGSLNRISLSRWHESKKRVEYQLNSEEPVIDRILVRLDNMQRDQDLQPTFDWEATYIRPSLRRLPIFHSRNAEGPWGDRLVDREGFFELRIPTNAERSFFDSNDLLTVSGVQVTKKPWLQNSPIYMSFERRMLARLPLSDEGVERSSPRYTASEMSLSQTDPSTSALLDSVDRNDDEITFLKRFAELVAACREIELLPTLPRNWYGVALVGLVSIYGNIYQIRRKEAKRDLSESSASSANLSDV